MKKSHSHDVSVLIYSCDKYADVWGPFFTLFFRYWDCPYPVYVVAESEQCLLPDVMTINKQGTWSEKIHDAVHDLDTEYVIGMCEDFFMRQPVRQDVIDQCIRYMNDDPDIACFNFEKEYGWYEYSPYGDFGKKPKGASYRKSCQPTLWRRSILEKLLEGKMNAWQWELSLAPDEYKYYIYIGAEDKLTFEYGYHNNQWVGLQKGMWVARDVVPLFEREGIHVDYSIRGMI